jgi:gas vesicle protein
MKKFWIGLALGALAGGVAALLLAPQSGASTRRKVRRSLEDMGDSLGDAADYVKEQAERLGKEAQKLVDNGKSQFGDVLDAAQDYARAAGSKVSDQASRLM